MCYGYCLLVFTKVSTNAKRKVIIQLMYFSV